MWTLPGTQIVVRDGKGQKDRVTMLPERFCRASEGASERVKAYLRAGSGAGEGGRLPVAGPLLENIRMPARNGSGNMSFLQRAWPWTRAAARPGGTTFMECCSEGP